jgi:Tol biopolymer transport system component
MNGASGGRQPVTGEANLDEHVFALSPDGAYLLYTVATDTVEFDGPFNDLYLLHVGLVGEKPARLPVQDVLWAGWSPDSKRIAYSTGVKSGPPGWKARNDLVLLELRDAGGNVVQREPRSILPAQPASPYSWWGSRYAWSPDGKKIAYARPDQIGWIDLTTRRAFPIAAFAPLNTHADWVWVPTPTWSPDSWFVACTIHAEEPGQDPQASQRFEVWAFDINHQVRARLTPNAVGMWSTPRWSPSSGGESQIAYAEASVPGNSNESRYVLKTMDRDGSNKVHLYPREGEPGITRPVEYRWSPDGSQIVVLYLGDLYLMDISTGQIGRLTGDGQCTRLDWAD